MAANEFDERTMDDIGNFPLREADNIRVIRPGVDTSVFDQIDSIPGMDESEIKTFITQLVTEVQSAQTAQQVEGLEIRNGYLYVHGKKLLREDDLFVG